MHVIICGGRTERLTPERTAWLDHQEIALPITHVFHGAARGIDTEAGDWARIRGLPVTAFPADWPQYDRAAGAVRNAQMLQALQHAGQGTPVAVLAFPGGQGTADMVAKAQAAGVRLVRMTEEHTAMATMTPEIPATAHEAAVALYGDHLTALRVVLDQMQVSPYNDPPTKLEKAYTAVLEQRVTPRDGFPEEAVVASAMRPFTVYKTAHGTCECPYARTHPDVRFSCHHAVAARLYQGWQQSLSLLNASPKETPMPRPVSGPASAPLLTPDVVLASESPHVPQEAPEATPEDIPEHPVPPAVLEAVTGAREPSKILPPDFGVHEALLQGFCQYLQGKMHTWMMEEHRTLTAGMDTTMAGMRDYAKSVLDGNEHAQYQLSDALLKLCESGLPVRQDPYVMHVAARSPEGFAVTIDVSKASVTELVEALPALLAWLTHSQFTPGVLGGRDA